MHARENNARWGELPAVVKKARRKKGGIRLRRRVPAESAVAPSDDELLRYLDGAMSVAEQQKMVERLQKSPMSRARLEMLADALAENGWPLVRRPGRGSA
jgi:hypothetical protein